MDRLIREGSFFGKLLIRILIILITRKHGRTKLKWKNKRKMPMKFLVQAITKKLLRSLESV